MEEKIKKVKEEFGEIILKVVVELGREKVTIQEMLNWHTGSIVKLNKTSGESVDILVENRPIAKGEVMVIDEKFAVRVSDIYTLDNIIEKKRNGLYE
ncbi:FliM/FliN family flagellar motor switch protein [Deferribacter thermophilus]|uniref:FliM/FliN family flagellar motor switch protein n=1 Tax=Deferribacter thermophilus TaxID=53573 RepID=UPI003C271216